MARLLLILLCANAVKFYRLRARESLAFPPLLREEQAAFFFLDSQRPLL